MPANVKSIYQYLFCSEFLSFRNCQYTASLNHNTFLEIFWKLSMSWCAEINSHLLLTVFEMPLGRDMFLVQKKDFWLEELLRSLVIILDKFSYSSIKHILGIQHGVDRLWQRCIPATFTHWARVSWFFRIFFYLTIVLAKYGQNHDFKTTSRSVFLLTILFIYDISVFLWFFGVPCSIRENVRGSSIDVCIYNFGSHDCC